MKKIICALAVAALVSAAFAADPKVSLQARVSGNLVTHYLDGDDSLKDSGVALPGKDIFGIEYKDDKAGAYVAVQGQLAKNYSVDKASDSPLSLYDYYGWMSFGALKVTAGEWENRYSSRVNADLSSFGGICDLYYGPMKADATKEGFVSTVYESDNITPWATEFALDYSFAGGVVSAATGSDSTSAYNATETFGARFGYKVPDSVNLNATFAMRGKDQAVIGAFADILMVEKLSLVAGYSGYRDFDVSENSLNALELRARYVVTDAISVTSHNNATFGDKTLALFDMVNLAYKINDVATPSLMVANTNFSGDNLDDAVKGDMITVRPGVTLSPRKGATIDAGCKLERWMPDAGDGFTRVSVPVVFRVKF